MTIDRNTLAVFVIIYNLCLVAGAAFLIVNYEWSLWTFVGAAIFTMSITDVAEDEDD
jgi:uncharacterized paraquat-inducible protein A